MTSQVKKNQTTQDDKYSNLDPLKKPGSPDRDPIRTTDADSRPGNKIEDEKPGVKMSAAEQPGEDQPTNPSQFPERHPDEVPVNEPNEVPQPNDIPQPKYV